MKKLLTLAAMLAMAATMSAQVTFTVHGGTKYQEGTEGCEKAFDNNLETKWLAGDGDSYVDLVASENVRIMGFTYVTANDNKQYGRLPKEWEFFASNDATAMDDPLGTWNKWTMVENTLQESTIQQEDYTAHYIAINAPSTAYKYYRLKFVNAGWQLSEIIPAYGPEYQPPYTALDGYGDSGESFYNIFDNNTGSKWCKGDWGEGTSADDALWWVVFKTSKPLAVSGYTITTANDADGRDPKDWKLYGSNATSQPGREDGSWVEIDNKEGQIYTTDRYADVHFNVNNPTETTYKWFKWEITKVRNDGNMTQVSEFMLDGQGYDGAEDKLIYYRSQGTWGDGSAANMFDGNPNTKFGGGFNTSGYGAYVTFGPASQQQISITGYSLQVGKEWGNYGRIPKSWTLYGGNVANTPESTWEEIHTVTADRQLITNAEGESLNSVPCKRGYYHLDAPSKPYKYFKIVFNEVQDGSAIQVAELVLYYPHDVTTNWMELRDDTAPVFNGVPNVANFKLDRSFATDRWYTFCSPVALAKSNFSEVKELTGVAVNGDNYTMTFSNANEIVAGKPYMVKVSNAKSELTASNVEVATIATPVKVEDGSNSLTFNGVLASGYAPLNSFIISNNVFYNVDTANTVALGAFRGYITTNSGSSVKAINFDFEDDATGISLMEDGRSQMEDGAIYNVAGQRLNKMQKGINIVNGKKILK